MDSHCLNNRLINFILFFTSFKVPILLSKKVQGQFSKFDGYVVIDQENNRALFSVKINSMELNYDKYKELLLSNIFFDEENFLLRSWIPKNLPLQTIPIH